MKNVAFILMLLGFIWSCNPISKEPDSTTTTFPVEQNIVSKNITTSPFTDISTTTVSISGATIKISKPNTSVDGIEIVIPANSYTSNQSLKVSYAEIKSHQFGANFNPISPIISVILDGGYSNDLMSITIPVKIPTGHIPMGFYLDETTGKLESIPFKSITSNSITLLTRHFLNSNKLKSGELNLKNLSGMGANIVISSISESVLNGQPIIASGFKPGTDDWEFVNYGSYIATGGHCAGQNMAAMWYYYEKKPTLGSLFNKYSDNAKLWQDNARGYRFCSVIHKDLDWDGTVVNLFEKFIDKNQELDKLKLYTIAGAMLVTGEPQGIGIYRQTGVKADGTPKYGGHDLICYQVSVSGGKLYISDPNTPGTGQAIDFANNKFMPYMAKLNGHDAPNSYPFVTYYAKTAYIEWDKIGKRWDELVNNTIGTIAPNTFPPYSIWVKDKTKDFELKDGMTVTKDTLSTYVECPSAASFVNSNGKRIISSEVYGTDGLLKSKQNIPGVTNWSLSSGQYVKLTPGLNKLGYAITGWNSAALFTNSTQYKPLFIDFNWITVNYASLYITADQANGEQAKEVKFTARTNGTAPKSAKYVWSFGDGTVAVTKTNDSIATHTFVKAGDFSIKVELYDNSNNIKINEAAYPMKISSATTSKSFNFTLLKQNAEGNQRYTYQISGTVETKMPNEIISVLADTKINISLNATESYKVTFQCAIIKFEDDTFGQWFKTSPWSTETWRKTFVAITDWKGTNGTYSQLQIASNGSGTITGTRIGYGGTTSENNIWGIYKYLSEFSTGSRNEYTAPTLGFIFVIKN